MRQKGSPKPVNPPNFWRKENENQVSDELKRMIHEQYLSHDSLYVYCDCSVNTNLMQMSVACSYVCSGRVIVKQQYVYPPQDCIDKPMYGELKSIVFGLTHYEKYLMPGCKKVIFFSDVDDIQRILHNEVPFKRNTSLQKVKSELILLYQKMKKKNPNLTIDVRYLSTEEKIFNPFHRSSHNAAKKMLRR